VTHDIKYAGYVARQQVDVDRQKRLAEKRIPASLQYTPCNFWRWAKAAKITEVAANTTSEGSAGAIK